MVSPRVNQTATLLPNGTVLIDGGGLAGVTGSYITARIYDPATASFSLTGTMAFAQ